MADRVNGVKTPAEKVKDFLARSAEYERAAADMVFKTEAASPGSNAGDAITQLRYAIEVLANEVFSDTKDCAVKATSEEPESKLSVANDDYRQGISGVGGEGFAKTLTNACDCLHRRLVSPGIRSIQFKDDCPNDKVIIVLDSGIRLTLAFDYLEYTVEV